MSALSMTRRKFVAIFTALTLALATSMLGAAPVAAYAADQGQNADNVAVFLADADGNATSATIAATNVAPTATVGAVTNLLADIDQYVTVTADGTYHLDFAVTGGTKFATVNKHKGELTGVAAGTAKVTVYVVSGAAQSNNNSTPCSEALASTTLNVVVSEAATGTYGFQGNEQSIKLSSITPTSVSGSNETGWTNEIGTLTVNNKGLIKLNYTMSSGIGPSWDNYANVLAVGKIALCDADGEVIATLDNTDVNQKMYIALQSEDSKTDLTLYIDAQKLKLDAGESYSIVFASDYSAGNTNNPPLKTLGCTVTFNFSL